LLSNENSAISHLEQSDNIGSTIQPVEDSVNQNLENNVQFLQVDQVLVTAEQFKEFKEKNKSKNKFFLKSYPLNILAKRKVVNLSIR
jgi:hypothetical protein